MDLLSISIGNSRTKWGLFAEGSLDRHGVIDHASMSSGALAEAILSQAGVADIPAVIALASVNPPVSDPLFSALRERRGSTLGDVLRLRHELPIPIRHTLVDDSTVGTDRLLNALGAFSRLKQACVIADAGTAMTVDFVDGQGTFHGGAIGPGLNMMLKALHEQTAALPLITFENPVDDPAHGPFGRETRSAMLLGVRSAAIGMVRVLVERYAEFYGGYPAVIATGGNARSLFEGDEIVERIVPELPLLGIDACWKAALEDEQGEGEAEDDDGP